MVKRNPVRQRYRMLELQRWRDKRGLDFHLWPAHSPFDGRLADGTVIAVIEAGYDPEGFLRRAFSGVPEQQLDLADHRVLVRLANDSWLPGEQLVERAGSDDVSAAYERTGRMLSRRTCSVRPPTCWMARYSGDKTGSNCWPTR